MRRHLVLRVAGALGAMALLGGCASAKLDRQEAEAAQRECASLLTRGLANGKKATLSLDGQKIPFDSTFYDRLGQLRPQDLFALDTPKVAEFGPHTIFDPCKDGARATTASSSPPTTTTTTTTTTARPGG